MKVRERKARTPDVQLFNMIKKQLPDGLRWNGKDIEIHGVKITPDYAEKNCVLARGRNFERKNENISETGYNSNKTRSF